MNKLGFLLLVAFGSVFCGAHYDNYLDNRELSEGAEPRSIVGGEDISFPFFVKIQYENGYVCSGVAMLSKLVVTTAHCAMNWDGQWMLDTTRLKVWQGNKMRKIKRLGYPQELDTNNVMGTDIAYLELSEPIEGPFYPPCNIEPGDVFTDAYVAGLNGKGTYVRINPNCNLAMKKESEICFHKFGGKGVTQPGDQGGPLLRFPNRNAKCLIGVVTTRGMNIASKDNIATRLDYYWTRIMSWYQLDSSR